VLINNLQHKIKRQLLSQHSLMAVFCCLLMVLCGLLSKSAIAYQQPIAIDAAKSNKPNYLPRVKQDPTRPPSVIVQQLAPELAIKPKYELTAIFTRDNHQYAVVNGNVVKAGDPIADMLITEISAFNLTMKPSRTAQDISLRDSLVLELSGSVNVKKQVKE
jgi:hypothetical protein